MAEYLQHPKQRLGQIIVRVEPTEKAWQESGAFNPYRDRNVSLVWINYNKQSRLASEKYSSDLLSPKKAFFSNFSLGLASIHKIGYHRVHDLRGTLHLGFELGHRKPHRRCNG